MTSLLKMDPAHPEKEKISQAAAILESDGLIGYPTETVYGLGANIFSERAVQRIFEVKGRSTAKAIIVIVSSLTMLEKLVKQITPSAQRLIQHFWPGPLTLIFEAADHVPRAVCGGGTSIAIRIPKHPVCLDLIERCGFPLTSTSANLAGGENPLSAGQVQATFGNQLDLILDAGPSPSRVPSTLLDLRDQQVRLLRAGAIELPQIERICRIEKS